MRTFGNLIVILFLASLSMTFSSKASSQVDEKNLKMKLAQDLIIGLGFDRKVENAKKEAREQLIRVTTGAPGRRQGIDAAAAASALKQFDASMAVFQTKWSAQLAERIASQFLLDELKYLNLQASKSVVTKLVVFLEARDFTNVVNEPFLKMNSLVASIRKN